MPDTPETGNVTEQAAQPAPEEERTSDDWSPQVVAEDGTHMTGDYPTNHRLRAEALVKARRKHDPDGIVSDDLIADTATRLRAEREAE